MPLQSGAGFSLAATARRLVFPLHPLVAPGPQSSPVQDKPLCAMTLKDSYVPALFLGVLSTVDEQMALPSIPPPADSSPSPHFTDRKTETQKGKVTGSGS